MAINHQDRKSDVNDKCFFEDEIFNLSYIRYHKAKKTTSVFSESTLDEFDPMMK